MRRYVFKFNFHDTITHEVVSFVLHSADGYTAAKSAAWAELGVMMAQRENMRGAEVLTRFRLVSSVQVADVVWADEGFPCGS